MIFRIESPEQAEKLLRSLAEARQLYGFVFFDIDEKINPVESVPLVLRRCDRCDKPSEYCGWNVWGKNFEKRTTYCFNCGYNMPTLSIVTGAIQGDRVIHTLWR